MKYNHEIHKRRSVRLKGYDYSRAGLYFITICVQNRKCLFGKIENVGIYQGMSLHDIGQIAHQYWLDIPNHCPRMVLHEHIIMPNHMHGIIQLTDAVAGTRHGVSLPNGMTPQSTNTNQFGNPVSGSVSMIINQYKSSVKRWCNKNGHEYFQWQSRFHDHIIRNQESYETIANYIINNPAKWQEDKFYQL